MTEGPLQVWFRAIAGSAGFAANRSVAHRHTSEVIQVLNLQKSNYGRLYYINFGIALKSLGATNLPREEDCHIRIRLTGADDQESDALARALDLDLEMDRDQRILRLEATAGRTIRDFVQRTSSMEGIKALYRSGGLRRAFIHRLARRKLED